MRTFPTKSEAIKIAHARIVPSGYKPEDYTIVGSDIANKIAMLVYKEYLHILKFGISNA